MHENGIQIFNMIVFTDRNLVTRDVTRLFVKPLVWKLRLASLSRGLLTVPVISDKLISMVVSTRSLAVYAMPSGLYRMQTGRTG